MARSGRNFKNKKRKLTTKTKKSTHDRKRRKFNFHKTFDTHQDNNKTFPIKNVKQTLIENKNKHFEDFECDEVDHEPMQYLLSAFKNSKSTPEDKNVKDMSICEITSENYQNNRNIKNIVNTEASEKEIVVCELVNNELDESFCTSETAEEDTEVLDDRSDSETVDSIISEDPFDNHLKYNLSNSLYTSISGENPIVAKHLLSWPILGKIHFQIPKVTEGMSELDFSHNKPMQLISEKQAYANCGQIPSIIEKIDWSKMHIKTQIQNNIIKANYVNIKDNLNLNSDGLTPLQKELFSLINNYQDLLYCERSFSNETEIMFIYSLHIINHLLKTRIKILHHNSKLSKYVNAAISDIPDEYRDQGLVRPKVLVIVPFRHSCLKIVNTITDILFGDEKQMSVINQKRFFEEFSGNTIIMPKINPKPEDYEATFTGNTDDTFKIGISITKKTLKLYSDFYSSDVIISSPLGLRMIIGGDGEDARDYDFLASIELLVIDQTDIILMQNWDHLIHVLNHLHLQPKKSHNTDITRVRNWSINGWSKFYRQTLIFSSIHSPEIHSVFNKKCVNYAGNVKVVNTIPTGSISQVVVQLPQVFCKFDATNHKQAIKARFEFFTTKILPEYKNTIMNHTLIFIPSYFDYVKLRNFFKKEELNFVQICEYSKDAKVARARDMFFHSDAHFLLYSERFHFFHRIRIKGIRHVIFFAPPTFPHFYSELCNLMHESNQNPCSGSESNMTITTLYSKYDTINLTAILGTERAAKMITSNKSVHMIITDN